MQNVILICDGPLMPKVSLLLVSTPTKEALSQQFLNIGRAGLLLSYYRTIIVVAIVVVIVVVVQNYVIIM